MHPSRLIKDSDCMISQDMGGIFDNKLKEKIMNVHPLNFIKSKVILPLFRVSIEYDTIHENHRESEKYMIMNKPMDEEGNGFLDVDFQAEIFLADYNKEHPKEPLRNLVINSIDYICDLVLPIG